MRKTEILLRILVSVHGGMESDWNVRSPDVRPWGLPTTWTVTLLFESTGDCDLVSGASRVRGIWGQTPLLWIRSPTPSLPSCGDPGQMRTPGSALVLSPVRGGSRTPRRAGED